MSKAEIRETFGLRKGTKLEQLAQYIVPKADKPVKLRHLAEKIHGKGRKNGLKNPENATRNILIVLNRRIKERELPYRQIWYGRNRNGDITVVLPRAT